MGYSLDNVVLEYGRNFLSRNKLPQVSCARCAKEDHCVIGVCPQCLENRATVMNWLETHPFIGDNEKVGEYHEGGKQAVYKTIPLRLPNEHPFLYYGMEVEIEFDDSVYLPCEDDYYEDEEDAESEDMNYIIHKFNEITGGLAVWERDGSLSHGVECIFRPMSYAYLTHPDTVDRLRKGFQFLREMGAETDQPTRNGLHIHISKAFFENGRRMDVLGNELTPKQMYSNFDWLCQVFQDEIEELGGRRWTDYCQGRKSKVERQLDNTTRELQRMGVDFVGAFFTKQREYDLPEGDHYTAVNSTPQTIEVRVFKSSVDVDEILARVELVRNMAHCARENYAEPTFNDLLHYKDNKFLDDYARKVAYNYYKKNGLRLAFNKVGSKTIELAH